MTFSHPQTAISATTGPVEPLGTAAVRNETAYGSLFLEPDLPVGTDSNDTADFDEPEFVEPTREGNARPNRNQTGRNQTGRNDARRTNRRRTAA